MLMSKPGSQPSPFPWDPRGELLARTVPFWLRHGVDAVHGGFICGLTHAGDVVDDSKFYNNYYICVSCICITR